MPTVVLLGTLDTKGQEYGFLADLLRSHGVATLIVDAGVRGSAYLADIGPDLVAEAAGARRAELASAGDRGAAVATMARGAVAIVSRLHAQGRLDGIVALGGSGGASLATAAMRALPVGVPKLMVTTVAAGDTRPYVGARDVTMMPSIVDIAGINRVSARILANAAAAISGMVLAEQPRIDEHKPLIGASMFGVTTLAVDAARARLDDLGYEVLVFHQTGVGGESMEALADDGFLVGMLDLTTTELADELVGGVLAAHPARLEVAGRAGIAQVVSVGALDMVNFGPLDSVPEKFRDRNLYVHNPTITLMRTTPDECAELGRRLATKLNVATGPTALFLPLGGVSAIATPDQPFYDPAADDALFSAIRDNLASTVELIELDTDINDPSFARAAADRLHEMKENS